MRLLDEGQNYREIAKTIGLSKNTVAAIAQGAHVGVKIEPI
ncbi:hypothetical protein [Geothrix edaphica]|nr:hypothetical protein [Geothrix edaphica]